MHDLPKVLFFYHGRAGTKPKAPGIFPHASRSLSGGAHLDIHISLPLVFLHFFLAKGPWAHLPSLTAYLFPSSCSRNDNSHNQDHPRQLGDSSLGAEGGEHRARCTGWKYFEEHWIKWCWYSSVRLRKKSGVLFTSGFLPWGDGRAERKADTSRSGGCHLFRFHMHSNPRLTSDQLSSVCSKPGEFSWGRSVTGFF